MYTWNHRTVYIFFVDNTSSSSSSSSCHAAGMNFPIYLSIYLSIYLATCLYHLSFPVDLLCYILSPRGFSVDKF